MKMMTEDYTLLKTAIAGLAIEKVKGHYVYLQTCDSVKDLATRFRWDLLWASKVDITKMYGYLNDTHINTALKQIVKELNLP